MPDDMGSPIAIQPPEPDNRDIAVALLKGVVANIPITGGMAAEVLSLILAPSLNKRQDAWISSIAQGLVELQAKVEGYRLEALSQNENFVTTLLRASQIAMRSHQKEKLEALHNAVLNASLHGMELEDLQQIFLSYVDDLTPAHIYMLTRRRQTVKQDGSSPTRQDDAATAESALSYELLNSYGVTDQLLSDLEARGLIRLPRSLGERQYFSSETVTKLGSDFLEFISAPPAIAE
jgi:hypothetical protein